MNRLIALAVAAAIIFSCFFTYAQETDTDNKEVNRAVSVLSALNILTDYNGRVFNADTLITRGESIAIIVRILAGDELASDTNFDSFGDVPADWRTGYIALAAKLGIISGYNYNEYGIEDAVTFNQAVKMIVNALGYSYFAENSGGYPQGYILQATKLNFIKDIGKSGETSLTRGEFVRMIYKALDINILDQNTFGENSDYNVINGRNLLTEKMKVTKAVGKVNKNYITSLFNSEDYVVNNENVVIDDVMYKVGETDAGNYLGYNVEYYYKEDNDVKLLLYVSPAKTVYETTIYADDIDKTETTKYKLSVKNGNSNKNLLISENADVLFNGKPYPLYTNLDLAPDSGSVKLIDNDSDNKYDTVLIESYETYLTGSVSTLTNRINFAYPNGKPASAITGIQVDDQDVILEIYNKAGIMKFTSIKKNDVLSISQSKNTNGMKYIKILVSSELTDGILSETSNDTTSDLFIANNTVYKLNKMYSDFLKETAVLGRMYAYYIDVFGEIVFISDSVLADIETGPKYGYIVGIKKSTISKAMSIKLFDSTGVMKILETDDRIIFESETEQSKSLSDEIVYNKLTDGQDKAVPQLLQYNTDAEGKISEIKTAVNINDNLDLVDQNKFTVSSNNYRNLRFLENTHFGLKYFIGSDTVVMIIPPPENINDDKAFAVGGNLLAGQGYYDVKAYNLNEISTADVIIVQAAANLAPGSMSNMFIVEKIVEVADEDSNIRKKIHLNSHGSQISYLIAEDCLDTPAKMADFNKIELGDAIQLVTNSKNEISAFVLRFDVSNWTAISQDSMEKFYDMNGGVIIVGSGTIKSADGNFVSLDLDVTPTGETSNRVTGYFISYTRYYHVKKTGGGVTVKTIRKTDFTEGMKVMFFRYYHSFREIIVYEGF